MASEFLEQVAMTVEVERSRPMDLSISIVNWNSKGYLLKSIASIEDESKGVEFEIVVIDLSSFDGYDDVQRRKNTRRIRNGYLLVYEH